MKPQDAPSRRPIRLPGEGQLLLDCMGDWPASEPCVTTWTPGGESEFETLRYESFRDLSERTAGWLQRRGVRAGEVVILLVRDPALLMVSFWGTVLLGAVPAILAYPNFKMDPEKYGFGLEGVTARTRARLIVVDSDFPSGLEEILHASSAATLREIGRTSIETEQPLRDRPSVTPDSPALLQHSAGTTGLQKGVCLTHRQVLRQLRKLSRFLELDATDCFVSWLPLYHDMGLIACFLLPLVAGLPMVVQSPDDWVLRPTSFLRLATRFRATRSWIPNFAFSFLSRGLSQEDRAQLDLSSLRSLVNCSEPVTEAAMTSFFNAFKDCGLSAAALETSYALAENVFAVTHSRRRRPAVRIRVDAGVLARENRVCQPSPQSEGGLTLVSSGTCLEQTGLKICNGEEVELEDRRVGEVWIRSDCLFNGYFNPSRQAARAKEDWFKTGDVGFLDDQELYVLGRSDDVIVAGGRNIYPTDVEEMASGHPAIRPGRVVAFGVRNRHSGTQDLVIVAELNSEQLAEEAASIERELQEQMVSGLGLAPRVVRVAKPGWMVKSSAGKPARAASRARFMAENADLVGKFQWTLDSWKS